MPQLDIIAIGECLVEFQQRDDGAFVQSYAGDTLNTLFYAARLGLKTGYVSAIGDDPFTEGIVKLLESEGIGHEFVATAPAPNGTYFVLDDRTGKTYHFLRKHSAATRMLEVSDLNALEVHLKNASILHLSLTSIGIQSERKNLLKLLRTVAEHVKITFDSNYRSSVWQSVEEARTWYEQMLPFVDTLFVTDSDHQAMYGEEDLLLVIKRYQSFGIAKLAYRMGVKGSVIFDGKVQTIPAIEDTEVIDTTGAGDAFNAGFIFSMLSGQTFRDCGQFATACAAQAIEEHGGMAKTFSRANVDAKRDVISRSEVENE